MRQQSDSNEDIVSVNDLDRLSTQPPPPEDVHYASTKVGEVPSAFLEAMKSPAPLVEDLFDPPPAEPAVDLAEDLDALPLLAPEEGGEALALPTSESRRFSFLAVIVFVMALSLAATVFWMVIGLLS